jgi:hypothetical protein
MDVGKNHPQALIYPLVVASASSSKTRQSAAYAIMGVMKEHSRSIVEQVCAINKTLRFFLISRYRPNSSAPNSSVSQFFGMSAGTKDSKKHRAYISRRKTQME